MTHEEAINRLNNMKAYYDYRTGPYYVGFDYKDNDAVDNAIKVLEQTRWIPCSEILPKERGFYLTTTKDKAVYCDYWNEDNFDRTEMVIAWMPLPEPYKAESEVQE